MLRILVVKMIKYLNIKECPHLVDKNEHRRKC